MLLYIASAVLYMLSFMPSEGNIYNVDENGESYVIIAFTCMPSATQVVTISSGGTEYRVCR
jgi:hypothetical protein